MRDATALAVYFGRTRLIENLRLGLRGFGEEWQLRSRQVWLRRTHEGLDGWEAVAPCGGGWSLLWKVQPGRPLIGPKRESYCGSSVPDWAFTIPTSEELMAPPLTFTSQK